jgi:hypothetical protein
LEETRKKLEEANAKVSHLGEINAAYTSDIKIHRRIEGKLKKELEFADERRRQAESDLEDQRKISEKVRYLFYSITISFMQLSYCGSSSYKTRKNLN